MAESLRAGLRTTVRKRLSQLSQIDTAALQPGQIVEGAQIHFAICIFRRCRVQERKSPGGSRLLGQVDLDIDVTRGDFRSFCGEVVTLAGRR